MTSPDVGSLAEVRDQLANIAFQLETQTMLQMAAAARNPLLAGTPLLAKVARRLGIDPAEIGLVEP